MIMIELSNDELWDVIYSSRDSEKYWRLRRRLLNNGGEDIYTLDELNQKFQEAKDKTKWLESLTPDETNEKEIELHFGSEYESGIEY